jgi:hypothetical protein
VTPLRRIALAVVVSVAVLAPAPAAGVSVGEAPPSTTLPLVESEGDGIIPRPNSGNPPAEAGDRGGSLQLALLGLILVVIATVVGVVVRQSRRAREGPPR